MAFNPIYDDYGNETGNYYDPPPAPAPLVPASMQTPQWAPTPSGRPTEDAYYRDIPGQPLPKTPPPADSGQGTGLASFNMGDVPRFDAPEFRYDPFAFDQRFKVPTAEDLYADPSYISRRDEGAKALEQSAAGRGTLRTGGTLKDILQYGQNFASREYGTVYDRGWSRYLNEYEQSADKYRTNYGVSRDIFDRTYQGAKDEFAPLLLEYQTQANVEMQRVQVDNARRRQHDEFVYGIDE